MKRSERRLLEEKLRYVAMEDIKLDPQREQQMLDAVKADFLRQSAEADVKRSRGHGIGRRVLIASAAAVLLIVLSFGYTVLIPESVTHAKGFVRTAAIWVNNTFHLGYEFEEPVQNTVGSHEQDAEYSTLEEAAANIPYPLVYLDDPNFELQSISLTYSASGNRILIDYLNREQSIMISLVPVNEDVIEVIDDTTITLPWQNGKIFCWETDSYNNAFAYSSGMEINIIGTNMTFNVFLDVCQNLRSFN